MNVYCDQIRVIVEDARMSVLDMWLWANAERGYAPTTHTRTAQDSSDAKASEPSIHDDNDGVDGDACSGNDNDDDHGRPNAPAERRQL